MSADLHPKSISTASKGSFKPDSDVHITYIDQQRINEFARRNAKLEDNREELKYKQNQLSNIEDAFNELELMDDDEVLTFKVGEVFICQNLENTQKSLTEAKETLMKEIEDIRKKNEGLVEIIMKLKTKLYAKFGNHINLEDGE